MDAHVPARRVVVVYILVHIAYVRNIIRSKDFSPLFYGVQEVSGTGSGTVTLTENHFGGDRFGMHRTRPQSNLPRSGGSLQQQSLVSTFHHSCHDSTSTARARDVHLHSTRGRRYFRADLWPSRGWRGRYGDRSSKGAFISANNGRSKLPSPSVAVGIPTSA